MSVKESTKSYSSILKKPKILSNRLKELPRVTKIKFVLPHTDKVRSVLENYVQNGYSREYEQLVVMIRDAKLTDEDLSALLKEATECISILDEKLKLFIEALLAVEWINKDAKVVSEYQSFVVNLLAAHNYHSKMIIDRLVKLFLPGPDDPEWPEGIPSDESCSKCINVHSLFNLLLVTVPMCQDILISSLYSHFPYHNKSTHIHEYYIHNLLWILDYRPNLRPDIFSLIISKLVIMDVNAPREEIEKLNEDEEVFSMEDDSKSVKTSTTAFTKINRHTLAHTLDMCLDKLFNYIISECHDAQTGEFNWEKGKKLYLEMLPMFDRLILPTYDIHHTQYIMFLMSCFKTTIAEGFLNYLWKKVCNPNVAPVLRQTAVNYIASFVARGKHINLAITKGTIQQLSEWIHSYISTQDGLEYINSDIRIHSVFYSVCQALFYIIAFRHKDLVETKKNIIFLESLNLAKIVTSRLNPLRVCQPAVVQNFAAITRKYQLAYCYTVIEHNSRNKLPTIYQDEKGSLITSNNTLSTFFPFDPFVLERSGKKIEAFYRVYEEIEEQNDMEIETKDTSDADDFLYNDLSSSTKQKTQKFSYGSSPGFKF